MYRGCTVAVVVPAYNEAGFVGEVVDTLPEFVDRAYVVDDASTDRTWTEIREHAAAANRAAGAEPGGDEVREQAATATGGTEPADAGEPIADGADAAEAATAASGSPPSDGDDRRVVPVRHGENRGVGGAITTGYRRALADGADVTAVMNGDGQMDPAILDRVLDPVVTGRAGYAKGDRLTEPERRGGMSRFRLFGNALLTGLTRVATGYWGVTDPQNGYTAISREALSAVDLGARYEDYGFCNDMLAALSAADVRVADVPTTAVYGDERSGIRYSRFVPGLSALLLAAFLRRLWRSYVVRELHPLVALYALGAAGLLAGAAGVAGGVVAAAVGAHVAGAVATLAGGLAGLLGAGLGSVGAAFDRAATGDRVVRVAVAESADRPHGDDGPADRDSDDRDATDEGPAGDAAAPADVAGGATDGDPAVRGSGAGDSEAGGSGGGDPGDGGAPRPEVRADGTGAECPEADDEPPRSGGRGPDDGEVTGS